MRIVGRIRIRATDFLKADDIRIETTNHLNECRQSRCPCAEVVVGLVYVHNRINK
jgi:hypothetical protein